MQVDYFSNSGKVSIENNLFITQKSGSSESIGVSTDGVIEGDNPHALLFVAKDESQLTNDFGFHCYSGGVNVSNLYWNVSNFDNGVDNHMWGRTTVINCFGEFSDDGSMECDEDAAMEGSIWIGANSIYNDGNIVGGKSTEGIGGSTHNTICWGAI